MDIRILKQKLSEPELLADGTTRNPNWAMRRAAKIIDEIASMGEQDKNGRLKAEQLSMQYLEEILKLRKELSDLETKLKAIMDEYAEYKAKHAESVSGP